MAVSCAQVYHSLRRRVYLSSPLTSYGFKMSAGSENFTSERILEGSLDSFAFGLG